MNDDIFKEIYPNYKSHIAAMEVRSQRPLDEREVEQIKAIIRKEHNSQISIETRSEDRIYYTQEKLRIDYRVILFLCIGIDWHI